MTRSTTCRFCHLGGDLIKGAHKACKNIETRERLRILKNIDPSRYMAIGDRGQCKRCDKPAEPLSKLNLCREHMEENKKEVIRKAKRKHMKKKRAEPEHVQPRVYVKPPQSQKMQRMSRAEKREVEVLPVLDTPDERARVAELLERARMNRVELPFSRWS
jgi:ribosomal protein S14